MLGCHYCQLFGSVTSRNQPLTKYLQFDLFLFSFEISKCLPRHPVPKIKYE